MPIPPDKHFITSWCKKLVKSDKDFTTFQTRFKIGLQSPEQDILKKDDMLSTLGTTPACL